MKNFYPFQVTGLRFQVDHNIAKKIKLFEAFSEDPNNERFFVILLTHQKIEMIADGKKIIEVIIV